MAAELSDKAPTRTQRTPDPGCHRRGIGHPVQCRIGEYGIEFGVECQPLPVHQPCIDTARLRRCDERRAGIDPDDIDAAGHEIFRDHTVTATEVENVLAGPGRQPFHHRPR